MIIRKGFTLAEVLITLSILGVIAAITVPSIVRNFQDRVAITNVKQAYSIIDNAMHMMKVIEGDPYKWNWPKEINTSMFYSVENNRYFMEKLSHYLNITRYCGDDVSCTLYGYNNKGIKLSRCTESGYCYYKNLNNMIQANNSTRTKNGSVILRNGMIISVHSFELTNSSDKKGLGILRVDINGEKGPNRMGYDLFFFEVDNTGIVNNIKKGVSKDNTHGYVFDSSRCKVEANSNNRNAGISCSTWIMRHNNMNYKYRDVSSEW